MALTLNNLCGFETGGLEEALATAGAPTINEVTVRTGDYSLKLTGNVAGSVSLTMITGGAADGGDDRIVGIAFYLEAVPSNDSWFMLADDDGDALLFGIKITTDRKLELYDANSALIDTSSQFSLDAWHFLEVRWQHSDPGDINLYIDGNPEASGAAEDLTAGGSITADIAYYKFVALSGAGADVYIDDFYSYSGASGVGDFLGDCEVFRYQANTNSATPDAGSDLDAGVWQNMGQTPTAADQGDYTGAEETGYIITDDVAVGKHYRHGPHGDANIDGTIEGAKWLHLLKRGNGSGTTHYKRFGNDVDIPAAPGTAVTLNGTFKNFFTISEAAAEVPLVTEHFAHGFGKSAGGREIYSKEIWAFLLHVPPAAVVGADEMMAAIAGGGGLGTTQPYIEQDEIVSY